MYIVYFYSRFDLPARSMPQKPTNGPIDYILQAYLTYYSLETQAVLQSTGFLRGSLQSTGALLLQFYRLKYCSLQSTDLKNGFITVYEKSIAPPLNLKGTYIMRWPQAPVDTSKGTGSLGTG